MTYLFTNIFAALLGLLGAGSLLIALVFAYTVMPLAGGGVTITLNHEGALGVYIFTALGLVLMFAATLITDLNAKNRRSST